VSLDATEIDLLSKVTLALGTPVGTILILGGSPRVGALVLGVTGTVSALVGITAIVKRKYYE